jgi:hypothetical protein
VRGATFAAVQRAAQGAGAVLLSGGLDSACGRRGSPRGKGPAPAFASVFPTHPQTDERELIGATARHAVCRSSSSLRRLTSILAPALDHARPLEPAAATPNLFVRRSPDGRRPAAGVDVMLAA